MSESWGDVTVTSRDSIRLVYAAAHQRPRAHRALTFQSLFNQLVPTNTRCTVQVAHIYSAVICACASLYERVPARACECCISSVTVQKMRLL